MRIEPRLGRAAQVALAGFLASLTACPGELNNKAEFEAYAATHPDAGAPTTDEAGGSEMAGGSSGSSGNAGSAGVAGFAGTAGSDACGDVIARIFVPSCGGTGCHSDTSPQQDLDLVSPDVKSRLVGVPGKQCLKLLVDPQNPEQSLLYQKLLVRPDCGVQMPLARPPLTSAEVACVLGWIAAP
jgi:hypothetical protein